MTLFLIKDHYDTIDYFDKKIIAVNEQMFTTVADDSVVKQLLQQPGKDSAYVKFTDVNGLSHCAVVLIFNIFDVGKMGKIVVGFSSKIPART